MSGKLFRDPSDDFWDLSDAKKRTKEYPSHVKSTDTVPVDVSPLHKTENNASYDHSDTVIHRTITPSKPSTDTNAFVSCEEYACQESLLHHVCLKKWRTTYHFYDEFLKDAIRYHTLEGKEAPFCAYFSYVPQYNQLSSSQLSYYLWWREQCRKGKFEQTDYSYILLYVYELINLGTRISVLDTQHMLTELWIHYHDVYPMIAGKLSRWICDFSLLHRLPPPTNANRDLIRSESVLKEFYIAMPMDNVEVCVRSLLKFCTSYDYTSSKFATGENLPLYHEHISGVLAYILTHFKGENGFLQDFSGGDSLMVREAFEGALCCSELKYRIEISYCSFSRTNELRYLIGDVIKYAENKLRAYLGIKSKLSVYSVTTDLREVIDRYFEEALSARPPRGKKASTEAYEALYDLPKKSFSLADARKIEEASWETTNTLISAFEAVEEESVLSDTISPSAFENREGSLSVNVDLDTGNGTSLTDVLGALLPFARAVRDQDESAQAQEIQRLGKMKDYLVDEINQISIDFMGDILIDQNDDGYFVPPDYMDYL